MAWKYYKNGKLKAECDDIPETMEDAVRELREQGHDVSDCVLEPESNKDDTLPPICDDFWSPDYPPEEDDNHEHPSAHTINMNELVFKPLTDEEVERFEEYYERLLMEGKALQDAEDAFRRVCREYGLVIRNAKETSRKVLREEERRERAAFWRRVLEDEITQKWFGEIDNKLKKQFNIKSVDELRDTPLRQFTGFIIHASGGREKFWGLHGQAYIAKVYFLMETAEDASNRYNLRKRIEEVLEGRRDLSIWRNLVLKNSGFI